MQASNRPPSASASLAATKAFIRDRESNGALSSAAAAAALRTHTTSPTPVGDTVTKRMVRKASISSQGSGSQRPGLRRHSSSGSMTERSFRAPSPAGSSPVDHEAPPVPAVPKNVPQVSVVKRRNSSLEPPIRGGSPAGRGGGRGVSLDRGVSTASPHGRGQPRSSPLSKVVEDDQDGGHRSSINFSRPISPPPVPSPTIQTAAPARSARGGWFAGPVVDSEQMFRGEKSRPKTSDGTATYATQQAGQNAAARPVSTKTAQTGVEGARLAAGSMRAKPSGTYVSAQPTHTAAKDRAVRIVDPSSPFAVYDPSSRKFIHKQDAMNLHRAMSDVEDREPRYEHQQMAHRTHQEAPRYSQAARQVSQTQKLTQRSNASSPVREEPPLEYLVPPTRQSQPTVSHKQEDTHGVAISHDEHMAFTAQEFAGAEDRLPADANTSRKLESSVLHHTEEAEQTISPKFAPNQDSSYPRLAPPAGPTSSNPPSLEGSTRSSRTHSMSPPRNAHFAAVAAVEFPDGVKHQPPGRSVSPAKSALKASPSVSRRSHSPLANDGRVMNRGAPSEISDAVSEDGSKKKKKVRISFEEEPIVLGTSAYADTQLADMADNHDMGLEEDPDDFMRPRPVLPSFGSIRDKNRRSRDEEVPEKVTETVSSSLSNSATLMGDSQEMSSDHKIGGILAHDFGAKQAALSGPNDPLPPEVTTVEGSGYWSDSDKSEDAQTAPQSLFPGLQKSNNPQSSLEPEPKTLADPIELRTTPLEVPMIAVQPASPPLPHESGAEPILFATPSVVSQPKLKERRSFVPGGWDDDDVSEPEVETKEPSSEPAIPAPSHPSITIQIPERPVDDDDDSSDNSSIYSDAYEDIEEGEGFGSIDAIMESPVQPPTSRFASSTSSPAEQRIHKTGLEGSRWAPANVDEQEHPKSQGSADWEKSQQYWSEVNGSRRQQPQEGLLIDKLAVKGEPEAVTQKDKPAAQTRGDPSGSVPEGKFVPASKTVSPQARKVQVEPAVAKSQTTSTPAKSPAQPRKSALKKPVATTLPAEVPMKKTMRNQPPVANRHEPQMRMTMRGTGGGFAGRGSSAPPAHRQSLPPLDTKSPRGALQKKHLPAAAAGVATKPRPQSSVGIPIKPKPAYQAPVYESDSDASVSSFQRERRRNRGSRQNTGSYTMRSSMRSGTAPTMRATPPVRSISPPRNAMPPSQSTLKKSMRPSSPTLESPKSVKSSRFSIRSLSPGGRFRRNSFHEAAPPVPSVPAQAPQSMKKTMFGKQSESRKSGLKAPAKAAKPFKSRFNDSSDEEDDRPRRFQSRFADSDSEDEDLELPTGLTPVRGIPKRPGEEDGDSTDLEDEASDNEPSPTPVANGTDKGTVTNGSSGMQGTSLAAGSLREQEVPSFDGGKKAKRGFFGLGKKKNFYVKPGPQASANFDIPMPPAQQNRDRNRPLTPIGEDRDVDPGEVATSPPKAGRQAPFERSTSDSWPLPSPNPGFAADARPQSADGPLQRHGSRRPTLVKRHSSQISQARTEVDLKTGKTVAFGKTGKKKKFQGLRRVFGLND